MMTYENPVHDEPFEFSEQEELVEIPMDMPTETFLKLALMAHEMDVTFNDLVTSILCDKLLEEDSKHGSFGSEGYEGVPF